MVITIDNDYMKLDLATKQQKKEKKKCMQCQLGEGGDLIKIK